MTNRKIERVNTAIDKTKAVIAEQQAKLRELERQKIQFENEEIVAMFRRERLNEDEFAKLLRLNTKDNITTGTAVSAQDHHAVTGKEAEPDEFD